MSDHPARPGDHQDDEEFGAGQPDFAAMFQELLRDADNPMLAQALQQMGVDVSNPATMQLLSSQLAAFFGAAPDNGINPELTTDIARKTVAAAGDSVVSGPQRTSVGEAVHVANLWLDDATGFGGADGPVHAWSRAEWVAHTMPTWLRLVGPVAEGVTSAMSGALTEQLDRLSGDDLAAQLPEGVGVPPGMDIGSMLGGMAPMMRRMTGSMFGAQTGQAIGHLAGDVLTGDEVGLPLIEGGSVAMLPANIEAFAEGTELDAAQVRLYLAVREAARVRLFRSVPWLGPQVLNAVEEYARGITIDTEAIEAKLSSVDPTDQEAISTIMSQDLFASSASPAQQAALSRLETLLALIEGWVDVVSERATANRLPSTGALGEAVRRRRASGGPAEATFAQLVGLELRPRRLRDAANLFAALENSGGAAARDAAFAHPDVAPTAADLDDPLAYVERVTVTTTSDVDDALAQIFADAEREGRSGNDSGSAPPTDEGPAEGPTDAGPWPNYPEPPK